MNNNELTGELLNFLGEKLNIDLNDVLQKNEDMRKKQILETHKAEHKVWQSNGKRVRWYTYIPDNNSPKKNKTKLLVRTTEEDLEEAIIDYYISTDKERNSMTIEKLYKEWFQYKEKHTNSTTYMHRIDNDWQKYYKGTYIIKKPIVDLDFLTVENWALDIIRKNDMPRKTYSNMTIIIRQILDYAVNKSIIDNNVFSKIKIPSKLFKPTKRKNDETQVFMVDEKPLIVKSAYDDYEDSDEAVCLGVAFLFETGLRIGEMLALEFSDIYVDKPYISITKSEIKCEEKKPNGKWVITGYEVVPHAKTKAGERDVYLTEKAREILNTVRIWNKENGFSDNGYSFNVYTNGTKKD